MTRDTFVSVTDHPHNERVIDSRRSSICAGTLTDAPYHLFDFLNAAILQSTAVAGHEHTSLQFFGQTSEFLFVLGKIRD
jgi:hypothetical protein